MEAISLKISSYCNHPRENKQPHVCFFVLSIAPELKSTTKTQSSKLSSFPHPWVSLIHHRRRTVFKWFLGNEEKRGGKKASFYNACLPCVWCLHGIVRALNYLSRLSLKLWCQTLAEKKKKKKKEDFINDLINHQNSPSRIFSLIHSSQRHSLPAASFLKGKVCIYAEMHTHLLFFLKPLQHK